MFGLLKSAFVAAALLLAGAALSRRGTTMPHSRALPAARSDALGATGNFWNSSL